jgi:hypothetical protein
VCGGVPKETTHSQTSREVDAGLAYWTGDGHAHRQATCLAGGAAAELMLSGHDRTAINGVLFKLDKQKTPDKAMSDRDLGQRLWNELVLITGLAPDPTRPSPNEGAAADSVPDQAPGALGR